MNLTPSRIAPLTLLAVLAACATNPVTGQREFSFMSEAQEISIGQESHPQIIQEMGSYDHPELQRYVSDIGLRLAKTSERPQLPWRFTVVDQPVVNAFAVPGGFIYITRGILAYLDSEAQLVGVIGHEIGHVTARHSAQQYTRALGGTFGLAALSIFVPAARPFGQLTEQALGVLFLKYGRDDELQSDSLGAKYSATNGWDPRAVPQFLATLGRLSEGSEKGIPNWLSTHPDPASRVDEVGAIVEKFVVGRTDLVIAHDEYLKRIDGIIYGDNPEQGIVRANAFLHPGLRFRLEFPKAWEIQNTPQQVVAKAPGANVFLLLQLVQKPQGRNVEEVAATSMRGFRVVTSQRTTINGLDAFIGVYQGALEGLGNVAVRAAHIAHNNQIYMLAGLAPPQAFEQSDSTFLQSIRSFQAMSAGEAEKIRPNLVDVDLYVVRPGDTWESIAERSGGVVTAQTLSIMNNFQPRDRPTPGARIKIVVAG
jgi:predicted Zn-dependent protease